MRPYLESSREKIKRANKNLADLNVLVNDFRDSKGYEVVIDRDTKARQKIHRLRINKEPPPSWGPVVGDILYDLRSALDHLACDLVRAGGGTCDSTTEFPIAKNRKAFESRLGSVKGARIKSLKVLRAHKPYSGGNDLLWTLHQLNRVEKHRFPLVIFARPRSLAFTFHPSQLGVPTVPELRVAYFLSAEERARVLKDGDILGEEPLNDESPFHTEPIIEIAFGEPDMVRSEPMLDTLHDISGTVERVVESFAPLLPGA